MRQLFLITAILIGFNTAQGQETGFSKSQILYWTGKAAIGGYAPEGTLQVSRVEAIFTSKVISSLQIEVDMNTLEQENTTLRDHLKEEDFFFVEKYPTAEFRLTRQANIVNDETILVGTMTIKGVTMEEEIQTTVTFCEKGCYISFEAVLDRTEYNITYNSPSVFERLKENAIADEFQLKGTIFLGK